MKFEIEFEPRAMGIIFVIGEYECLFHFIFWSLWFDRRGAK